MINRLPADERASIETLIVATESSLDFSKAASTWVHDLLGLSRNCRLLEVKQACFAGIGALQMAAAMVATSPYDARALVIAGDIPHPTPMTYAEPSQGAGAVAVLVGPEPRIISLEPGLSGCYSYETADFFRPRSDVDILDVDRSIMSYVNCLCGAVRNFQLRVPGTDFVTSFDQLAMHTPFPGMPIGAHRAAIRKLAALSPDQLAADAERRVLPSIRYAQSVGNIYAGSTLLAMLSTIEHCDNDDEYSLGVFSYGSGCSSEFLRCHVRPRAREQLTPAAVPAHLTHRRQLTMSEYDSVIDSLASTGFGVETTSLDMSPFTDMVTDDQPRLVMSGINGYHRKYTWSGTDHDH
jgi:polyketide biosynthesis 3-hydroxy-3-methylglutaryl-CoA synthase-like enzyme PksG